MAATGDGSGRRILALGEAPVSLGATPDSLAGGDHLLTWNGHAWVEVS